MITRCAVCHHLFAPSRVDARTCSPRCRKRLSRRPKQAHQARIAKRKDATLDYRVERIEASEAQDFIRRFEWLGTVGNAVAHYGARRNADGDLVAVAAFARALPHYDACLIRGACAPTAHRHTASWFIRKVTAMAHADHGWQSFVAYADPEAGEVGVVYQSAGWHYVGQGRENGRQREYYRTPQGRVIGERNLRHRGLTKRKALAQGCRVILRPAKHTYVHFEGDKPRIVLVYPYPKREPSRA